MPPSLRGFHFFESLTGRSRRRLCPTSRAGLKAL